MHAGRPIVISPHLDDAVLGCGALLAARPGAVVITVCTGTPADAEQLTAWDAACGYASAGEAMAGRRAEDRAALELLGARPVWLDRLDDQYGEALSDDEWIAKVADELSREIDAADPRGDALLLVPLGLFHPDHGRTHAAARRLFERAPQRAWHVYGDAIYRRVPGLVQERLAELAAAGIEATPVSAPAGPMEIKRSAIDCYASQLQALATPGAARHLDALTPESYWQLRRPTGERNRRLGPSWRPASNA